jgi:hypothetical protein
LLYPDMIPMGGLRKIVHSWTHWALRQYIDQGFF